MKISVIDSPMGFGKTSWAIQNMSQCDQNFVFFTPFISETLRVRQQVSENKEVCLPWENRKKESFRQFIREGRNVASTHALLSQINFTEEDEYLIRSMHYDCYLDETINAIEQIELSRYDFKSVMERYVSVSEDGKVAWRAEDEDDSVPSRFQDVKEAAQAGNLYCCRNSLFVWLFPLSKLQLFDNVYILTYMFESSTLCSLLKAMNADYSYAHIEQRDDRYELIEGKQDDHDWKQFVKERLHIYEGPKNLQLRMTATFYRNLSDADRRLIKNTTYNVLHHVFGANNKDTMWSCFSGNKEELAPARYQPEKCYVACNAKATNDFADRHYLAYLVNIFPRPMLKAWFEDRQVPFNDDSYALSQMIQWIWRSAIRKGEQVWLYVPNRRMRQLLCSWLDE